MRKKKFMQETSWATAHFQFALGHDTGNCIMTQGWGGMAWVLQEARHGQGGAQWHTTIRPRWATTWMAVRKGVRQRARARPYWWGVSRYNRLYRDRREAWPLGLCRDTNGCIVTGGWPGCWMYCETCGDMARNNAAIRSSMRHNTTQ